MFQKNIFPLKQSHMCFDCAIGSTSSDQKQISPLEEEMLPKSQRTRMPPSLWERKPFAEKCINCAPL